MPGARLASLLGLALVFLFFLPACRAKVFGGRRKPPPPQPDREQSTKVEVPA